MASRRQIEETYNFMDEIFRLSLGETADFSGAMFRGDFSKSLEEAQADKHSYILRQLNICEGSRVLDIGCGWGPMLKAIKDRGGQAIGLTLSTAQARSCRRHGLEAHVLDWKNVDKTTFGAFDAVVSLGAFEHFCSKEEYLAGEQDRVYDRLFRLCHDLLRPGGRFYLQTMVFGKNMIEPERISLKAPGDSDSYMLALMEKAFPGSWLPYGDRHLTRIAAPYFEVVTLDSGRKDYIETINRWNARMCRLTLEKLWRVLALGRYFLRDVDFRHKLRAFAVGPNRECFRRELMDHLRIVFARR